MLGIIWLVVHSYGENQFKYFNMEANFMFLKIIRSELRKVIIKIPLVDRWLISQLLPPMLFAIGAFTAVSLSVGIMFDLVRKIVEFGLSLIHI